MDFTGKVVLITGASSGIGADAAVLFSSLGAKLSLTGRNEDKLKNTVKECKAANKGCDAFYVIGDISKEEDIKIVFGKTIEKYGRLDILVNNAGYAELGNLETTTIEQYDAQFNTNVRGVLILTKLAMPYLIKSKGNVVNISSVAGLRPSGMAITYSMSKSALDQFTKCVALEVAPKQVRVNSVNPGGVITNFPVACGIKEEEVPAFVENFAKRHAIGRFGTVREISNTIAFLASDLASNVTGSIFVVDGGSILKS